MSQNIILNRADVEFVVQIANRNEQSHEGDRLAHALSMPSHPYEDPIKAIEFALEQDMTDGIDFLRAWNVGDWDEVDEYWPGYAALLCESEQ